MARKAATLSLLILTLLLNLDVALASDYQQIAGLIDLRTTLSDGAYDLEFLVQLAKKRSFSALFINDHDRMVIKYRLPPFRNIFKRGLN